MVFFSSCLLSGVATKVRRLSLYQQQQQFFQNICTVIDVGADAMGKM